MKRVFGTALTYLTAVTASLIFSTFAYASCGKIKIAEMNWASAELMANVDKIILEKGYGCEVEMVAGATMPTFTSMNEKGTPDVDNLFAKFGNEEPHFCFGGHTDVVPIGEEGAWSNNPF